MDASLIKLFASNMRPLKALFPILLQLISGFLPAQSLPPCTNLAEFASETCSEACAGCPLNGYQGTTAGFSGEGGSFCGGQLNETNSVWHGFIAGSSTITFSITSSGCTQGNGLQAALFSSCGAELSCQPGQPGGGNQPIQLSYNGFTPGESYLLLINGYDGDVCGYTVATLLGTCDLPGLSPVGQLNGPTQVCPGGVYSFTLPSNPGATGYEWVAPPGSSINATGQNTLITTENTVEVVFGGQGNLQMKARALGYCGSSSPFATKNVLSQPIPPTVLPTLMVDPSELPYTWSVNPNNTLSTTGSFQLVHTLSSWTGCDSIVRQLVIVAPKPSGIVFWDINGNNQYNEGIDLPAEGEIINTSSGVSTLTDADGRFELPFLQQGTVISITSLPVFALQVVPQQYQYAPLGSGFYAFSLIPQKGPASGRVYTDVDQNLQFSLGDLPIAQLMIRTSSGKTALTNTDGTYQFAEVAYPEEITPMISAGMQVTGSSSLTYQPNLPTGYDFTVTQAAAFGAVYWDLNQDGGISPGDLPAPMVPLVSNTGAQRTTNQQGIYSFSNLSPNDTIKVDLPGLTPIPAVQVVQTFTPAGGYSFLLPIGTLPVDMNVDATHLTAFRPGFTTKVTLTVTNESPYPIPYSSLGIRFPGGLQFSQAQPFTPLIGTDSLHWELPVMAPFASRQYYFWLHTPVQTPLGTPVQIKASLQNAWPDTNPSNDSDLILAMVVGAYDPNDKQVQPAFITPAELAADPGLEYTIRFQNTGNFPAEWVELIDTLSPQLDWSHFRFISSSHPCTWEIGETGLLRFFFADIQLPDSLSNPEGSQGFVKFWIPVLGTPEIGAVVSNFCDIYFDFNPPIRTNTAELKVVLFAPGGNPPEESIGWSVRPNPASFAVYFSWSEPLPTEGSLRLFNPMGLLEQSIPVGQGATSARMDLGFIPNGWYFARLEAGNVQFNKVVVVQKTGTIRRG